jgi:hypothetical protein
MNAEQASIFHDLRKSANSVCEKCAVPRVNIKSDGEKDVFINLAPKISKLKSNVNAHEASGRRSR